MTTFSFSWVTWKKFVIGKVRTYNLAQFLKVDFLNFRWIFPKMTKKWHLHSSRVLDFFRIGVNSIWIFILMGHIKVFHWQGSNSQLSSVPKIRFPKMTLTQLSGFGFFSKGSQKSLSLARFELTIICIGALFVVTKWYMIIEYKHHNQSWKHKFLNSQTVQTIHHSQQGPGRGEFFGFLGYLYFYAVRLAFQILK